jgi:hypothetical protein
MRRDPMIEMVHAPVHSFLDARQGFTTYDGNRTDPGSLTATSRFRSVRVSDYEHSPLNLLGGPLAVLVVLLILASFA